jgi:para-nitrobenzyl esterase
MPNHRHSDASRIGRRLFLGGAAAMAAAPALRATTPDGPVRDTAQGPVRGTAAGDTLIFKGIPFARPPVGALRFRPPQPAIPWQGVRDATAFAPIALQVAPGDTTAAPKLDGMSEDCLYLNVYAPDAPGPHPVFVWIHGGGNSNGSATIAADGSVFARRGIVCVTIAYRLGAFGFLELGDLLGPDYAGSGANALRDQIAALHWVRANIASFGGDPDRVTIGGVSAGAKNVVSLCASPLARGLFGAAIVESGGVTTFDLEQARAVARTFGAALPDGVSASDLPKAPPGIVLATQRRVITGFDRPFPFRAIVGTNVLPLPTLAALRQTGRANRLLIGTNRDESILFIDRATAGGPLLQHDFANVDVGALAGMDTAYDRLFPGLDALHRRVRLVTAEEYGMPSIRVADAFRAGGGHTYAYRFSQPARSGPFAGWAGHGFEVPYVWQSFADPTLAAIVGPPDDDMRLLANEMTARWCAFIRSGRPDTPSAATWPMYDHHRILRFEAPAGRPDLLESDEIKLWNDLRLSPARD